MKPLISWLCNTSRKPVRRWKNGGTFYVIVKRLSSLLIRVKALAVINYQTEELASDSEDEKRMKTAKEL